MLFKNSLLGLVAIVCVGLLSVGYSSPAINCKETLQNSLSTIEKIQTLKFHLVCHERVKGILSKTESQVKMKTFPRSIYIYLKGQELLWVEGINHGNALINPNGFPYVNLNLSPSGSIMRENQHHTLHEVGFTYFAGIIKNYISLSGDLFDHYFRYEGLTLFENTECVYITAETPDFKYVEYTVLPGETLTSIAQKLNVSDYMLLELNRDHVKNYTAVKAGQNIKTPTAYGKKITLYIDKQTYLPRVIKVYDDKGLYESYEYHHLLLNPTIPDEEFTKDYKGYRF
jgi:LysM repeat protein